MVSKFVVKVVGIDVKEDSRKAQVLLMGGGLNTGWYNITNNNDSSFAAMVTVFTAGYMLNETAAQVTVVFGGIPPTDKEIEQVIIQPGP
jgi:hypothetical protein